MYKERLKERCFDPCNQTLKFWECECHPHTLPKVGLRHGAISCSNKRQPTIALLMTEVEYMINTQGTKETIWMTKLMKELGYMKEKKAMVI